MNFDEDSRPNHSPDLSKGSCRPQSEPQSLSCSICSLESFEYYPDEATYRALFDADETSATEAVVGVISEIADIDPLDVEQLGSNIDTNALNSIVGTRRTFERDVHISFTLNEYDVTLSSYGSIVVQPPDSNENKLHSEPQQ